MDKKEKHGRVKEDAVPDSVLKSDPRSLKDNPAGETVCSPHFSQGCINEDTVTLTPRQKGKENEKY